MQALLSGSFRSLYTQLWGINLSRHSKASQRSFSSTHSELDSWFGPRLENKINGRYYFTVILSEFHWWGGGFKIFLIHLDSEKESFGQQIRSISPWVTWTPPATFLLYTTWYWDPSPLMGFKVAFQNTLIIRNIWGFKDQSGTDEKRKRLGHHPC